MPLLPVSKHGLFYGWVVVVAAFLLNAIVYGTRYTFGVFFKSIEGEFGLTRGATSGVFSTYMVLCCAFALFGGWAVDRYGPRVVAVIMGVFTGSSLIITSQTSFLWQIFITYSLLFAVGTGSIYAVVMPTVSRWFDKKRGLALGIAGAGVGLGTLLMAPFATYLLTSLGWRMAFMVLGLFAGLLIVSFSTLLKKHPAEVGALPDGLRPDSVESVVQGRRADTPSVSLSLMEAFKTRSFWSLLGIWLLWSLCLHLVFTHLVPHATDVGVSPAEAAVVLSVLGFTSIPARLIVGVVSDKIGRKVSTVICALLQAAAMFWLIWSQDLWMFYMFAVVFGFGYGGLDPPVLALIGESFGLGSLGVIMGALVVGWGTGAAIGPAVAGFLFDISGSYSVAFLLGALAMLVTTLLVAFTRREVGRNS